MSQDQNLHGARESARIWLSSIKRATDPNRGIVAYHAQAATEVSFMHIDAVRGEEIVEAAERGDPIARGAVEQGIAWYLINRVELPDRLREYLVEMLVFSDHRPKVDRRKITHKNYLRDGLIVRAVRAVEGHGFAVTRNPEHRGSEEHPSACSIVSGILAEFGVPLDESTVEKILAAKPER